MATPVVLVWLGDPSSGILIGKTYDGSGDSINLLGNIVLAGAQYLTVQFIGGDAGATSTVSLYGTRDVQ
jgi:hypothetical protein